MSSMEALIDDLRREGVILSTDGVSLTVEAPAGKLTSQVKSSLGNYKLEIICLLAKQGPPLPQSVSTRVGLNLDPPVDRKQLIHDFETILEEQISILIIDGQLAEDEAEGCVHRSDNLRSVFLSIL